MPNIFVTGGAGYIGSVLIPKLINRGYNVRTLIRFVEEKKFLPETNKCEIFIGDLCDVDCLEKCLQNIDSVIHLAAISNDPCSDLNPKRTYQINVEATRNLINLSKKYGVKRFIYASSSSVYGLKNEKEVTEDLPLEPITTYSKTKALAEKIVSDANAPDFITVGLRQATACGYSPRMYFDLTVNGLTEQAISKGEIIVFGGEQKRPNIHVEDITDYYADLLEVPKEKIAGEVFNAGCENYRVIEIAEMVREVIGTNVKINRLESADNRSYHISSEKIKRVLDFKPKKTIKDAILDLKSAFDKGLIPNPESPQYKKINRMKLEQKDG